MDCEALAGYIRTHNLHPGLLQAVDRIRSSLSEYRRSHIGLVADYAVKLAQKHFPGQSETETKAFTAALLHDITKEEPPAFHRELLESAGHTNLAMYPKAVLHSKSAALFAGREYGYEDREVRAAIEAHTTGGMPLDPVTLLLICADYLASSEPQEFLTALSGDREGLKAVCLAKCRKSIHHLLAQGAPIHPDTIAFYNELVESA